MEPNERKLGRPSIRKLSAADSARIICEDIYNREFRRCTAPAEFCEIVPWEMPTRSHTRGASFFYFCAGHMNAHRERVGRQGNPPAPTGILPKR